MPVAVKRVYEKPSVTDGARVLVDRLWPRGLSKTAAKVDLWLRDLAPSNQLRRWFHARPSQWTAFRKRYFAELAEQPAAAALNELYSLVARRKQVTLLYASKNTEQNNATVLRDLLNGMRKPPSGSGPAAAARVAKRAVRKR
ncbi:MAG TPA: DUF488 family protein [Terriglobales bacterium]|nr:DUF488 family protein [Terriglobales bacterium]